MSRFDPSRALAIAAGLVIIALTGAAFWLSYAHLAEVALAHGLGQAKERAWAWPATLDLFIVAGELMMLRAALARKVDGWAIALTAVGSVGSIVLNVAGVTGARDAGAVPLLDYVVAAVPPTAALLAFGALMRQVHQALTGDEDTGEVVTPDEAAEPVVHRVKVPTVTPVEVSGTAPVELEPAPAVPVVKSLVICGDRRVFTLTVPTPDPDDEVTVSPDERLPTDAAATIIRAGWVTGTPVAETARQATRSVSYVKKVFARLDDEQKAQPTTGQLALVGAGGAS